MGFCRTVPLSCDFEFEAHLYVCYEEDPPTTWNKSKLSEFLTACSAIIFSILPAVSKVCKLESDLSKIPKAVFKKCENSNGLEYYDVHYDLVLTPLSASLMFELEFNSLPYGTVRSSYY